MSEQPLPMLPMWRIDHIEPSPEMLALRANGPIHRVRFPSGHEGWWVTGYDEAKVALSDAAFRPAGMPPTAFTHRRDHRGRAYSRAESKVLVGLPATSFDPRNFDEPGIFDIGRQEKPHLAFSHGPHSCIGGELAKAGTQGGVRFDLSSAFPRCAWPSRPNN